MLEEDVEVLAVVEAAAADHEVAGRLDRQAFHVLAGRRVREVVHVHPVHDDPARRPGALLRVADLRDRVRGPELAPEDPDVRRRPDEEEARLGGPERHVVGAALDVEVTLDPKTAELDVRAVDVERFDDDSRALRGPEEHIAGRGLVRVALDFLLAVVAAGREDDRLAGPRYVVGARKALARRAFRAPPRVGAGRRQVQHRSRSRSRGARKACSDENERSQGDEAAAHGGGV